MKAKRQFLIFFVYVFISLTVNPYIYAATRQVSAYINLTDPANGMYTAQTTDPNETIEVSASGCNAIAHSISDGSDFFHFETSAQSYNGILNRQAVGTGFYKIIFSILGNPHNYALPLSFNYEYRSALNAGCTPECEHCGVSWAIRDCTWYDGTGGCYCAQGIDFGVPVISGCQQSYDNPRIKITAGVRLGGKLISLLPEEVKEILGFDLGSWDIDFNSAASTIMAFIKVYGLYRDLMEIIEPGSDLVDVEFELDMESHSVMRHGGTYYSNGVIMFHLSSTATSSPCAYATTTFDNLSLVSITLPADYNLVNPADLTVLLDTGEVLPVTKECIVNNDTDQDLSCNDGDSSGVMGDNPCTGDNWLNCDDNCPNNQNPYQTDSDGDGVGDVCDKCPMLANGPLKGTCFDSNTGHTGILCTNNAQCQSQPGAWCDTVQHDMDGDGIGDVCDNCPNSYNPSQWDRDSDGVGSACDNCPGNCNPEQLDADGDGIGDVCDPIPGCGGCGQPACELGC